MADLDERLASPLARGRGLTASLGDPPQLERAYTCIKSALHALCEREYPHPDIVLQCLSHADLVVGAALSWGVFQKGSRILDVRVSFDWE